MENIHCKKRLAILPSPAGMPITKSLAFSLQYIRLFGQCRQNPTMAQAHLAQIKAAQHRNLLKKLCKAIPTTTMKRFWTSQAQVQKRIKVFGISSFLGLQNSNLFSFWSKKLTCKGWILTVKATIFQQSIILLVTQSL
jgi:hypothetical protein